MNQKTGSSSSFDFRRLVLIPVIPILIVLLLVVILVSDFLTDRLRNGWQDVTSCVSVEILRDGAADAEHYDGPDFPVVNRGDRLTVTVALPEELMVDNAVLGFNIPHVAGSAYYGEEEIWTYGTELLERREFIGNLFFRVPLRNEMWGEQITLELEVAEHDAFSNIPTVFAIPAANSIRFFFSQFQLDMLLFVGFFVIFVLAFFVFLFYLRGKDLRWEGVYLSAFCVLLGAWFLAGHGFFYAFSDNIVHCAHMEYFAFFLMPIPFCLFMCVHMKRVRRAVVFSSVMAGLFALLFIAAVVLNYTTADYHFTTFLLPLQALMLLGVVCFVAMLMRNQYSEDLSRKIIRYGVAASMLILLVEVARYNLSKYIPGVSPLDNLSFASAGMLVFAGALTVGYIARLTDAVGTESDRALLRRMAYVDVLTGISNRAFCNQIIEQMEKAGEKEFAFIFFDLNGLKYVNDTFGHDMGDRFLTAVAETLQNVFLQQQFCGRWGGDEFLVCLTGENIRLCDVLLRDFDRDLAALNESCHYPFLVSVSYGVMRSDEQQGLTVRAAINEADRRMYAAKGRIHKGL